MKQDSHIRLLVIDDDPDLRALVRNTLGKEGFIVEEAENGEQGVRAFQDHIYDVVLTDVMMPGMDGFQVTEKIRQLPGGEYVPILIMTGLEDYDSINKAYQYGATDFFPKPFNRPLLYYRLHYILRAKQTADALRRSERRLTNAQRIAKMGHWELYLTDKRMICSREMLTMLGVNEDEDIESLDELMSFMDVGDKNIFSHALETAIQTHSGYVIEHKMKRLDKAIINVQQFAEYRVDGTTREDKLVGTLQDITERKRAEKQIEHLAYYDKLTGLPNRVYLRKNLHHALAAASKQHCYLALMALNLDNFQQINGTLGYSAGDELLLQVKQRLFDCVRQTPRSFTGSSSTYASNTYEGNTLAHLGGDDFVILLADMRSIEDAAIVARRINDSLAETFNIQGHEVSATSSIGISIYPDDGHDDETLMKNASTALKDAKEKGNNYYKFYTKAMNTRAFERLSLEASLRKAIENNQFSLYYQPKVSLKDNRVIGAEALIRWQHPDLGMVSPGDFIEIAESTGMIVPIGEWVLEDSCRQIALWQKEQRGFQNISINLSAKHLMQKNLFEHIKKAIDATKVDPSGLDIEITESMLMDDADAVISRLMMLKELGVNISIDDFGTGYSSLSYLKKLPISIIKIDQSFIRGIPADTDDIIIVDAVIALSRSLGLKVVAEGIETQQQHSFLKEKECHYGQGYYFSPPLPADKFIRWVEEYNESYLTG